MSRRREATELARVLLLSTQEARFALDTSPHTLSSPRDTGKGSNTDDSREMEMRPVHPGQGVDPRLLMRPPGSSANQTGNTTSSQSNSGSPRGSGGGGGSGSGSGSGSGDGDGGKSTIEPVQSTMQRTGISTIQPFTPSAVVPATNHVLVPASSNIQQPNPHQTPSAHPASSVPHSVQPGPGSSTEKSETVDPSGPLLSPTQGSRRNLMPQPSDEAQPAEVSPPRPAVRHQYSRVAPVPAVNTTPAVAEKVGSSLRPYQLSSSPDMPTHRQPAPKPARKSRPVVEDKDDDIESKNDTTPLPGRPSSEKATGTVPESSNQGRNARRESPDPLLIGPSRPAAQSISRNASTSSAMPIDTPTNAKKAAAPKSKAKSRLSSAAKGKGKEKEMEKWADNEKELVDVELPKRVSPKRISSRVREQQAKEEAEKIERRRKRAEEKERLAKEAATKAAEAAAARPPGEASEVIEIVDDDDVEDAAPAVAELRPEPARTPIPEEVPKPAPRKSNARKRLQLSSSPAPADSVIVVASPQSRPASPEPAKSAHNEGDASVRASSVRSIPADEIANMSEVAEAGPSKIASPVKRPAVKKTATQSKKAAAAAAKKAAASAKKAASKVAPKSKEMIESDDDDDNKGQEPVEKEAPITENLPVEQEVRLEVVTSPVKKMTEPIRKRPSPMRRGSPEPSPVRSPVKEATPARQPLTAVPSRMANVASSSTPRHSPGPMSEKGTPLRPDGIKFKTERNDLASVLSKFPTSRFAGMSRRLKIAPLHSKIGPPKKELPPPPKKVEKRKKGESDEDDEEEDEEEDEDGVMRKKKKERGMEWYMVED